MRRLELIFLYYYDLKANGYREINLSWEPGLMEPYLLVKNDGFVAPLAAGARPGGEDITGRQKSSVLKRLKVSIIQMSIA